MSAGKSAHTAHLVDCAGDYFPTDVRDPCGGTVPPPPPEATHSPFTGTIHTTVRFEPEDCPPVDYYAKNNIALPTGQNTCKVHEVIRQQPPPLDPDKWVKAAEFVPKRVHLQATAIPVAGDERVESPPSDPRQYQNVVCTQPRWTVAPHQPPPLPMPQFVIGNQPAQTAAAHLQLLHQMRMQQHQQAILAQAQAQLHHVHQLRQAQQQFIQQHRMAHPGQTNMQALPRMTTSIQAPAGNPASLMQFMNGQHMVLPRYNLPAGYTASMTNITPPMGGPPIPAIVLKKRRRKKNRTRNGYELAETDASDDTSKADRSAISVESNTKSTTAPSGDMHGSESRLDCLLEVSACRRRSSHTHASSQTSSPDATPHSPMLLTSSCPDLTQTQWQFMDEFWESTGARVAQNNGYDELMSDVDISGDVKVRQPDKPEKQQQQQQHMSKSMINTGTGSSLLTNTKLHGLYAATTYISDDDQDNHIHITGNPMSSEVEGVTAAESMSAWKAFVRRADSEPPPSAPMTFTQNDACCTIM